MKHGSFSAFWLVILAAFAVAPAFGDDRTVTLEAKVLETFDNDGSSLYDWRVAASKFATATDEETFPKLSYVDTWPTALFGMNRQGATLRSLGLWGRFDRRGYNWIDIYPVEAGADDDADPSEIPIPGRAHYLDMWVWGSNLNFYLEAYVRDYQGVVHVINMGSLAYEGWKNLRAYVPNNIPQAKRILPRLASLSFVKFRLWTQPIEQVANFYVYFDNFKVTTDVFESIYDGDELADPERIQEIWSGSGQNN